MLDERQMKVCELLAIGTPVLEIIKVVDVSRQTVYDWKKTDEVKARLDELVQGFISSSIQKVASYAPKNVEGIVWLAEHADSEKVRLDARLALLNKTVPNTTKLTLDDTREDSTVNMDVLDGVMDDEDVTD